MSAIQKLLTDHIDLWTAAETEKKSGRGRSSGNAGNVYGIKKLRELILELAVRGKLVPQDPSDEPASELLKRIQAEKARLIAEGKIKKGKPLSPIVDQEKPFELPLGWKWVRLADLGFTSTGGTPSTGNSQYFGGSLEFIGPGQINEAGEILEAEKWLSDLARNETTLAVPGDILMVCIGGSIGKAAIADRELAFNQQINSARILIANSRYIFNAVSSIGFQAVVWASSSGSATPIINRSKWNDLLISLPPESEQHRIVAKVDELMALCDQLETQHSNAAEAHEQLVNHLLGTLTQSPVRGEPVEPRPSTSSGRTEFEDNWQRIAAHFDTLFTTEASIDALKQTLLQLAVMGKLVPQDPNDEPASELVRRVFAEKNKLLAEKKYQKTGKLNPIGQMRKYPENWVVVQIGEICPSVVPSRDKPKTFSGEIPWITLPSFPSDKWYLDTSNVDLGLTIEEANKYSARVIPVNSVLMSCIGRFGLTAINQIPVIPNQQIHAFIVLNGVVPEFLSVVIRVSGKQMEEMATSTTIAYLNKSNCESIEFGLPPEAEQHRIIAKIDELMTICDQLKSRITVAKQLQQKLADVLVEQAVAQ